MYLLRKIMLLINNKLSLLFISITIKKACFLKYFISKYYSCTYIFLKSCKMVDSVVKGIYGKYLLVKKCSKTMIKGQDVPDFTQNITDTAV